MPTDLSDDVTTSSRVALDLDRDAGVAKLRIVRAEKGNGIDMKFVEEMDDAVRQLKSSVADLRVVLIEADGPHFTVGGDLAHFEHHLDRLSDELVAMVEPFHQALATVAELPVPVVCAVQGSVAGGGLGLLWCSDIIIAADDLKLVTAFAKLGVSGDGGSSWYLPRLVGQVQALRLLLESPTLVADEAKELGLVTRVVPRDELSGHAQRTASLLAQGPTVSLGEQRRVVRQAFNRTMTEGYAAELDAMRRTGSTHDAVEGMSAFVQRRTPRFEGR